MRKLRTLSTVAVLIGLTITATGCSSEKNTDPVVNGTPDPKIKRAERGVGGGAGGGGAPAGGGGAASVGAVGKN